MISLLNRWKRSPGGPTDASCFMRVLESSSSPVNDKVAILHAFNDWNVLVTTWFEVADVLPSIEQCLEDGDFPDPGAAALLVSKVYYCLERYDRALDFALRGNFNVVPAPKTGLGNDSEYVNKIIEVAIDNYKSMRISGKADKISPKLEALIDKIVDRNLSKKEIWYVIALGFETKNLDMIQKAINTMPNELSRRNQTCLLETLNRVVNDGFDRHFRHKVIEMVVKTYLKCPSPDLSKICECYVFTDNSDAAADTILDLLNQGKHSLAYQIAFDLYENASQRFLDRVLHKFGLLESPDPIPMERVHSILNGHETIKAYLDFFVRHNHTDSILLEEIRESIRTASGHNALLISNGLMQYGTTCDDFLRNNLNWVSKATNWNKFNAVASLGVIHHGQESQALKVLDPYLPRDGSIEGFGFKEGGAMFAYGLIHARHGDATAMSTLAQWLKSAEAEPVRHGSCLGYGVAGLGSSSSSAYEKIREVLQRDEAVSGESAGIAMGLIMAGNLNEAVFTELKQYSIDTQHDKTQRGIRTGLACAAFGLQREAEPWIESAITNKSNPMLRSTGVCMLSMAYAGTGDADVVRRLLEKVATDPNYDVKRYATMGIGFVLSKDPTTCLLYISMLTEHFNGHVRYGAALALGIACASSGNLEAIALLEPMISDKEGFVRNGALMALSLIMCQQTDYTCHKVPGFRKQLLKKITEKNEDSLVKFGAIISQGILDIGGQNAAILMHNSDGQVDMASMVGMMCFLHGWFWHTMHFFISLAAKPSCLVLVNENLKIPATEFTCMANSMRFAYPPKTESKKDKDVKKIETVVLSITGKKNAAKKAAAAIEAEKKRNRTASNTNEEEKMEVDKPKKVIDTKPTHKLNNPCRVIPSQREYMTLTDPESYKPVKPLAKGGIIVADYKNTSKPEEIVAEVVSKTHAASTNAPDPKPHSTFEININDY
ncbi:unnamed protein product [Caenorhabditis bovis]|uniref:26S proteasome non-ATPase regulatory subunit 1 n=1 Tax=Caenorhabditis bovis TaxID=2654633 RepID=A0A8S1ES16_9PELO|nr:unnamed protein product [Caenorhabditis bovis]